MRLTDMQKNVALTSLILALDKVDNTIGHYYHTSRITQGVRTMNWN